METKLNEFGDKIGKAEICQGILLILSVAGLFTCFCVRGCQEIRKHKAKSATPAAVEQHVEKIQNSR